MDSEITYTSVKPDDIRVEYLYTISGHPVHDSVRYTVSGKTVDHISSLAYSRLLAILSSVGISAKDVTFSVKRIVQISPFGCTDLV